MHGRNRHGLVLGVVTALALALSGCSGDGDTADPATDTAADDGEAAVEDDTADGDGASGDDAATDDASDVDEQESADAEDDAGTDQDADEATAGATVAVASSDLGDILVDGEGRTLYMFVPDEGGEPTCTDECAAAWPVFEGPATAGDGADGALLSTATHPSGATQVVYGGWPLYHFANDAGPGDVNGQGVNDVWFVLGPDGEPIRDDVSASVGDREY